MLDRTLTNISFKYFHPNLKLNLPDANDTRIAVVNGQRHEDNVTPDKATRVKESEAPRNIARVLDNRGLRQTRSTCNVENTFIIIKWLCLFYYVFHFSSVFHFRISTSCDYYYYYFAFVSKFYSFLLL